MTEQSGLKYDVKVEELQLYFLIKRIIVLLIKCQKILEKCHNHTVRAQGDVSKLIFFCLRNQKLTDITFLKI